MLYSVYAVLSVNWWSWLSELERDNLTLGSTMMVELRTRWTEDGSKSLRYGGYKRRWDSRGVTCLVLFRRPCISILNQQIGSCNCHSRNGKLPPTQNSPKSQFVMMLSPISPHPSLSHPQLYLQLTIQSGIIHLYYSMPRSWDNTKYCIYRVLHCPTVNFLLLPASPSAICKSVWKPHTNLPDTPASLTSVPK